MVSLDAIAHNFQEMHKKIKPGTKIIAVIKADGYGHGATAIAKLIHEYDYIWGFATATAEEALELRHAGVTKPILILGIVFPEYYEELAEEDIRITISDLNTAINYAAAGSRIGKDVHIHLALDTGMTRIGYADVPDNVEKIEEVANIPNLIIEGITVIPILFILSQFVFGNRSDITCNVRKIFAVRINTCITLFHRYTRQILSIFFDCSHQLVIDIISHCDRQIFLITFHPEIKADRKNLQCLFL